MAGILLFITFLLMIYPFYNPDRAEERGGKLAVTVSLYPMYDIVKRVGGDHIYLKQIIPFGTEPHSFEATPKDMMEIGNSQLFIYNGLIDPWAKAIAENFPREKSNLNLLDSVTVVNNDPHYWLDLESYKSMVTVITKTLIKLDSVNSEAYKRNSELLISEIEQLHNDYKSELESCKLDHIIVNHNAFGYLSRNYNFKTTAIMGLSPDDQPSAKKVAEIIDLAKSESISTIFFEELASDKVAQTVSNETGLRVSKLYPLGNISPDRVDSGFIELMRANLTRLKEGLDCQ
jgi:zinc transport system substrate-binding protein